MMNDLRPLDAEKYSLVLGHPGHELFVYGWMKKYRPRLIAMTDGSGRIEEGRIDTTQATVHRAGGSIGSVFGECSDRHLYERVLEGDHDYIIGIARRIADDLAAHDIHCVVGDAYERKYFTHDLCRLMIGAAAENASRRTGHAITCYEFDMFGYYGAHPPVREGRPWVTVLDDATLEEKLAAARSHTQASVREEIEDFLAEKGLEYFRTETLHPVSTRHGYVPADTDPPLYELHGADLVRAGIYRDVIRYATHVQPLADRLWSALATD